MECSVLRLNIHKISSFQSVITQKQNHAVKVLSLALYAALSISYSETLSACGGLWFFPCECVTRCGSEVVRGGGEIDDATLLGAWGRNVHPRLLWHPLHSKPVNKGALITFIDLYSYVVPRPFVFNSPRFYTRCRRMVVVLSHSACHSHPRDRNRRRISSMIVDRGTPRGVVSTIL